ncbi:MAG: hypothetical protein ACYCXB_07545 [Candidatus Humimicrobiaceae bacterium]
MWRKCLKVAAPLQVAKFQTILYVQLRLVCSAGVSPVRVRARSPVA